MTSNLAIAAAPEFDIPASSVDSKAFRSGMARLAAGVNIITSAGPAGPCGFTASAVCSVTDDPPTLLVCMNRSSQSYAVIKESGVLCVNTVSGLHEELSMRFAGANGVKDMDARFTGADWITLVTGAPCLADANVAFDCRVVRSIEIGTHDALFCEVVAVREAENSEGLVYFGRKFHRVVA
ncbi:flavin reductase [Terrarubrum flagellatum]|uniref:flavin reductase n=1 Tax=Terrirubrum flagellatum TaxID=2895980 RepID=UPI0031451583